MYRFEELQGKHSQLLKKDVQAEAFLDNLAVNSRELESQMEWTLLENQRLASELKEAQRQINQYLNEKLASLHQLKYAESLAEKRLQLIRQE